MKRAGGLWPRLVGFENLLLAWRKARRGKRARLPVARFALDLEGELLALQRDLTGFTYRPGPFRRFTIADPKPRVISAAPFRDRVVHHALCNAIEPVFERRFISDSYACRPGRGTHRALDRCTYFMRRHPFVLQCDVRRFFPSINHRLLLVQVRRAIEDPAVLWLTRRIVTHGGPRGLPIGNQTSQFLGNVMLDPLDHFLKERRRVAGYVRYCDDFLVFGDSREELEELRAAAGAFLLRLGLRLHPRKCGVRACPDGIDFLGFRVQPHRRRLRRTSVRRARRRLRRLTVDYAAGRIGPDAVTASIQAWIAHARHGQTLGLRGRLLGNAVFRPGPGATLAGSGQRERDGAS